MTFDERNDVPQIPAKFLGDDDVYYYIRWRLKLEGVPSISLLFFS